LYERYHFFWPTLYVVDWMHWRYWTSLVSSAVHSAVLNYVPIKATLHRPTWWAVVSARSDGASVWLVHRRSRHPLAIDALPFGQVNATACRLGSCSVA